MKLRMSLVVAVAAAGLCHAETIKLPSPDKDSGVTVTQAFKSRRSPVSSRMDAGSLRLS